MILLEQYHRQLATMYSDRKPVKCFAPGLLDRFCKSDYGAVMTWLKKDYLFDLAKLVLPLNPKECHWTLLVISIIEKTIFYYDSYNSKGADYLEAAKKWLVQEAWVQYGFRLDVSTWKSEAVTSPHQPNGVDCGVYTMLNVDLILADLPLAYDQSDIANVRNKIAYAILTNNERSIGLPYPPYEVVL